MRKTLPIFIFLSGVYFILQSSSSGVTSAQSSDMTNSPVASGACSNCHSGGSFESNLMVQLLDANDQPVVSYTPGGTYKIKYTVNATGASKYGIQSTVLKSDNSAAGTLTANSANAKVTTLNNRSYLDHKAASTSNEFIANWVAPAKGSGKVKIYTNTLAANGTGNTDGDKLVTAAALEINEGFSASIFNPTVKNGLVAPNPASEYIRFQMNETPEWIEVYSLSGIRLLEERNTKELNIETLIPGSYIFRVSGKDGITTGRFLKSE